MATPEELAAEKAALEAKEKSDAELKGTPQSLETALAELSKTRDALTAANHEAAERRKKLTAFEAAELKRQEDEKKRREAEMSDSEKLKSQMADLAAKHAQAEQELKDLKLRAVIRIEASKAKVEWASEVAEQDAIEILAKIVKLDDAGVIVGLDEQIKALQKERGYLFKQTTVTRANINADGAGGGNGKNAEAKIKELQQRFPRIKA